MTKPSGGRPRKQTVDYFPHNTAHKRTIFILEQQYGNDGYAFWFKLLELLGSTDGHFLDINDETTWLYLVSRANVSPERGVSIAETLSRVGAIDPELYENGIVWSQNFVDNLAPLYAKRVENVPERPVIGTGNPSFGGRKHTKGKDSKDSKDRNRGGRAKFAQPSRSEIAAFFIDKGLTQDEATRESNKFYDHYESNGWMVGKNKMKKWRNAAAGWYNRREEYNKTEKKQNANTRTEFERTIATDLLKESLDEAGNARASR